MSSWEQIATICCANTSSGFRGTTVSSIAPSSMRCATTADSRRSALAPLLARGRAVVRTGDLAWRLALRARAGRQLVQPERKPLGEPPVVDEDDRRAVLPHERQDLRVDRGPDRGRHTLAAGPRD